MVMGRKPIVFNDTQLKEIMRFKPTLKDTAAFFEVDPSTVENYIRKNWNCTFSEFRDQNMVHTRFMLIRTAIQKAEKGDNCMLIFCLKNLCHWRDKLPDEQFDEDKFKSMSTQDLIVFVKDKLQLEGQK
jgi:hypothetical protein